MCLKLKGKMVPPYAQPPRIIKIKEKRLQTLFTYMVYNYIVIYIYPFDKTNFIFVFKVCV